MLNELCQLADVLEKVGITTKVGAKNLNELPNASSKKPCYRVSIADDGDIKVIESLPLDLVPKLRKWEPNRNTGASFPGFNMQPLYRIVDDEKMKCLKLWREQKQPVNIPLLKSWCNENTINWDENHNKKLFKCLRQVPELICGFIDNKRDALQPIVKLIDRAKRFPWTGNCGDSDKLYEHGFRKKIEDYLWSKIEQYEAIDELLPLLIYSGSAEDDKDKGSNSVYLDIPDWDEFPVAHEETVAWLDERLAQQTNYQLNPKCDAFGKLLTGGSDTLPPTKLHFIGKVGLRSMNHESPCQYRYSKIDAESFPIGQDSRDRAQGSLKWLSSKSREGETWGRVDMKELVFAYPVQLPNVPLKLVACLGAERAGVNEEARFSNAAKNVIDALRVSAKDLNNIGLNVFSLRKMDNTSPKTKVIFHRNYTAQRLVDASQEWEIGCSNIPTILLRVWGNDQKLIWADPVTPYPLQVASCLNRVWKRDGTFIKPKRKEEQPLIMPTRGIELLLEENPRRFIPHLLLTLLQNSKGLLLYLGNHRLLLDEKERDMVFPVSNKRKYEHHKLLIPSLMGLLLYKLGIGKETYMSRAPFLVGRMLNIADELHALYCKEVREDKLPPQLIGNALMIAALESPTTAIGQLSRRIMPYLGWAKTNKSNSAGLSRFFLKNYSEIEKALEGQGFPERLTDVERVQLFLGYLASSSRMEENHGETHVSKNN